MNIIIIMDDIFIPPIHALQKKKKMRREFASRHIFKDLLTINQHVLKQHVDVILIGLPLSQLGPPPA